MIPNKRYCVALAGYYGFGNLGDELLAEAAIAALLRCGVGKDRIVLMSAAPEESRQKFGVDAVDRWKISQVHRALKQSKTLLLGGGGLFQDVSSLRSCFYYWGLVRAACFYGTVPWALGQSVGPFSTRTGLGLTRDALSRCRVVQVRDAVSEALCTSMRLTVETGDDLVFSLADSITQTDDDDKAPARLLVNLRPSAYMLAERFADAVSDYAGSFKGERVGIALSKEDEQLMSRLVDEGRLFVSRIERVASLSDATRIFCRFRGLRETTAAGMRLHFVMLAALARIPTVAVPYDPKVESFAVARNIPLWRNGALPQPQEALFPGDFSPQRVREDLDALCRKGLDQQCS